MVERLRQKAKEYRFGDPFSVSTTMGPLISAEHRSKVLSYYSQAREDGATVIAGGDVPTVADHDNGYWIEPTVWTGLAEDSSVIRDEIFGPCTHVTPFDSEEEVLATANNSPYGLATSMLDKQPFTCTPSASTNRCRHLLGQLLVPARSENTLWWFQAFRYRARRWDSFARVLHRTAQCLREALSPISPGQLGAEH